MDKKIYDGYLSILEHELIPAMGCTEPIAIALASAKAGEVLGEFPESLEICCSGNIIKNVMGVTVPNSDGKKGIGVAAVLGLVGGKSSDELEVLSHITPTDREKTEKLLQGNFFSCKLKENVENLYIKATAKKGEHKSEVTIIDRHTQITEIVRDGQVIFSLDSHVGNSSAIDKSILNIKDILEFCDTVEVSLLEPSVGRQISLNYSIAQEGIKNPYGAEVGRTLLREFGDNVKIRARAMAAAGSDARMGGCSMPVVISSGSGNQGLTVSLPIIEYWKELQLPKEKLYRAVALSNLISILQKSYIGSLSAFCGAVSAAMGAGAAITYLYGGNYENISDTITNTVANVGGIVCDGAKPSCAAKIASALDAAILGHTLSMSGKSFKKGEGFIQENAEKTMRAMGHIGKVGMKQTDNEILHIMTGEINF